MKNNESIKINKTQSICKKSQIKHKKQIDFDKYLGIGKNRLNVDAQEYVNLLREERNSFTFN